MNPYVRPADSLPVSRRTMIMNAGLAAAALAGLSSCTNYGTDQAPPGGASSGGGGSAAITAKTSDIPVGGGKIFVDKDLNQHAVITQPTEGNFKAFTSICTHAQCDVAEVTTTINCSACHGSKFSITDGSVVNPPAPSPLPAKTIKVDGDTITVT
jgi:nitrite reductase/ring-hydroxylating ferredoxin subunit